LNERVEKNKAKHQRKLDEKAARKKARRTPIKCPRRDAGNLDVDDSSDAIAGEKLSEEESSADEEQHEVFTLGRMTTRSQVQVNRYFTTTEVEEVI